MDPIGFAGVARELPEYRDRLLALESAIKSRAFDIRFCVGQPTAVCGA